MNPWYAKTIILLTSVAMVVIRAPHGQRSRTVRVAKSQKGKLEFALLTFAWVKFFLTLIWIATPVFAFADYQLHPIPLVAGKPGTSRTDRSKETTAVPDPPTGMPPRRHVACISEGATLINGGCTYGNAN
jgi:hypothetical protein